MSKEPLALPLDVSLYTENLTIDQLRAIANANGYELHSKQFSVAAQNALRELEGMRKRIDELVNQLTK